MKYFVIGGGTAGWLTALYVQKNLPYASVTVIASSELGILGAGEGTTPPFMQFLDEIEISPSEIREHAKGTIKTGIKFTNWLNDGDHYYHNFKSDEFQGNTALHFDANLLAKYLQSVGVSRGIKLIDDEVIDVTQDSDGYIRELELKSNGQVQCDFVFDCTGFRRMFIGKLFKSEWCSYQHLLPVNSAIPFFLEHSGDIPTYTESIAMKHGWVWKIPVQGRYGCGYVFDNKTITKEEAYKELTEYLGHDVVIPREFSFDAGSYKQIWIKNCIAIGLSSGFAEPLEATSIWVQTSALRLLSTKLHGIVYRDQTAIDEYNTCIKNMNDDIVDFIYFHYLTKRTDTDFWKKFDGTGVSNLMKHIMTSKTVSFEDIERIKNRTGDNIRTFAQHNWSSISKGICFEDS